MLFNGKMHNFSDHPMWMASFWLAMNVLMLDQNRVVMQKGDHNTKKFFEKLGLTCIEIDFMHCYSLGGSFHCYTADVRRRGGMQTYFADAVLDKHDEMWQEKVEKQNLFATKNV